jgi:hypothetical protein
MNGSEETGEEADHRLGLAFLKRGRGFVLVRPLPRENHH